MLATISQYDAAVACGSVRQRALACGMVWHVRCREAAVCRVRFLACGDCSCCPRHSELNLFLPLKTKQNKKKQQRLYPLLTAAMAIRITSFAYQPTIKVRNTKKVRILLHYARTTVYTVFKLVCIKTKYYIIGLLIEKKIHIYKTAEFMTLKLCV